MLLLLIFFSCKKKVIEVYPNIIGYWHRINWQGIEPCGTNALTIDNEGWGGYNNGNGQISGKAKIDDNDLYIGGDYIFTIVNVVDTNGVVSNPDPPSLCSNDNIQVSGLLRVINENGISWTFWRN